ncbi:MAG: aminodeoxychorismate synthase component I [Acidobacteriota bacterium]
MLLHRSAPAPDHQPVLFLDPLRIVTARGASASVAALHEIEKLRRSYLLAGWLAYELGYLLDPALISLADPDQPLVELGVYQDPIQVSSFKQPGAMPFSEIYEIYDLDLQETEADYQRRFDAIQRQIRDGDVYQVNYTLRLKFRFRGDPRDLYLALRRAQPVSTGALLKNHNRWILSLSPELFFEQEGERVSVSPMKGTLPRGRTEAEDRLRMEALAADPKNCAENLMIVDLFRNDLGRVARTGSVQVRSLFDVVKYPTLLQMTSTVEAAVPKKTPVVDLLKALLPSASVTGAPKISAMRIIAGLEDSPRGVYCGGIGVFAPDYAFFNVPIRTLELTGSHGEYEGRLGLGSGIVADSDEQQEWAEIGLKATFLTRPFPSFRLLESLRYENGFHLLQDHLTRLQASASYFDFELDGDAVEKALYRHVHELEEGAFKVRLLMDADGCFEIESEKISPTPDPVTISLAKEKTKSHDIFLFHKTTHRPVYDRARRWAQSQGFWEAILCNENDEITEGSVHNIFIRVRGQWWTPPVECGLLPGIMRSRLIEELAAVEQRFGARSLVEAESILLCNAVRGRLRAILRPRSDGC